MHQNLPNYSDQPVLTLPSLLTLPCPFLPTETAMEALVHVSPLFPLLLTAPGPCGVALWVWHAPPLRNLSLQWQSPLNLLASSSLNNNETYVLALTLVWLSG